MSTHLLCIGNYYIGFCIEGLVLQFDMHFLVVLIDGRKDAGKIFVGKINHDLLSGLFQG